MARRFAVEDLTPAIGSEVSGLDLRSPLPNDLLGELRQLWLDRKVLCFREQQLTPDQQLAFTRQFGELDKYPFLEGIPGYPLIAEVLKLPHEKVNFGGIWHSDTTYLPEPAAGASLYAIELPPVGGDTIFCDMESAWATLPEETKRQVAGLQAVNSSAKAVVAATRKPRLGGKGSSSRRRSWTSIHPVVRHHPETGRPALYVNQAHTLRFEGWSEASSAPVLAELFVQATRPEFQCRIRWRPGTLLLWDNRSTQHYPVNDYHGYRRLLHRISLKGDRPR